MPEGKMKKPTRSEVARTELQYQCGLSVIMPCYRGRKYILRALRSLENEWIDVEAIVIEYYSVDPCEKEIQDYSVQSSISIKYLRNEKRLGAGPTRNRGINEATKEYITFLDCDDEFTSDFFSKIQEVLHVKYDEIVFNAYETNCMLFSMYALLELSKFRLVLLLPLVKNARSACR